MCGIVGIVSYSDNKEQSRRLVEKMINVIQHRGPDGNGIYQGRHVTLGHVRLSIIDVEGSRQPLSNEDGSVLVSFNGEIYNYQDLRGELLSKGHILKTHGDTETLVHLYEEYGEQMVSKLEGMFAFVLWDGRKEQLLIVRDRMGVKPVYYAIVNSALVFASEPKAIIETGLMEARPKEESIWHYLTYRSVPSPNTLFAGIQKIKAGHYAVYSREGYTEKQYWDIPLISHSNKTVQGKTVEQYIEGCEALLLKSVQQRMISDVPLGAFLSGGLDSSLIVAMMSRLTDIPVKTYSVGFRNFQSSELPYAKKVADRFKTNHHELVLEPDEFCRHLDKLTWMRDSPLSERSDIPMYLLAVEARKTVKVLLSGEGSDELFAGYPKYAYDGYSSWFNWIPKCIMDSIIDRLPSSLRRQEIALRSLCEKHRAERWAQWFAPFTKTEKSLLMGTAHNYPNPSSIGNSTNEDIDSLDSMQYVDCKLWLPENLLERYDRMTMATSVEGREPFLCRDLIEYAFTLPENLKIQGNTQKWIIKKIAEKYLPADIIYRKKVGFEVPLSQWFRGTLKDMCYDRICRNNGLASTLFSRSQLEKVLDDHCSLKKDNFLKIWTLLGISIWYDLFCNGRASQFKNNG